MDTDDPLTSQTRLAMGDAIGKEGGGPLHDFDRMVEVREQAFARDPARRHWYNNQWCDTAGRISPVKAMLAFAHAATKAGPTPAFASTNYLAQEINDIVNRNDPKLQVRGGRGRNDENAYIDAQFFANAISVRSHPSRQVSEAIIELIATVLEPRFRAAGRTGKALADVAKMAFARPSDCLAEVLGSLALRSGSGAGQAAKPYVADIFATPPPRDFDETLAAGARVVLEELRSPGGARLLQFWGQEQSGKVSRIQHLIAMVPDWHVQITGGSRLPILALALDQLAPFEFVDAVHAFYRSAKFSYALPANVSLTVKLEEIRTWAKDVPALVIVADLDSIRDHEIVRSLHRDFVGDVLLDILQGHDDTRVLLTTTAPISDYEPLRQKAGLAKSIECQARINVCYDTFVQKGLVSQGAGSATPLAVRRLTIRLARAVGSMIDARKPDAAERVSLERQRNICFHADDQLALIAFAWRKLLSVEERFVFGLISASHDGLRETVIRRATAAAACVDARLAGVGSVDPEALKRKLCDLLSRRLMKRDAGQLAIGEAEEEYLYFVDRKWRPLVLSVFFEDSEGQETRGQHARLAHWLIAREAADQAAAAKLRWGPTVDKSDLLGRDIQCLHALVASIDPALVVRSDDRGMPAADLLAPLDVDIAPPPARDALRCCYFQLYQDIEDDPLASDSVWHNAHLRLAILLPLFAPGEPGSPVKDLKLEVSWSRYPHLLNAFSNRELAVLLTSVSLAAKRIQRFDIVCATARLAEALLGVRGNMTAETDEPPPPPASLLRVLRAEIDTGLFVSGNPESVLLRGEKWPFRPSAAKFLFDGNAISAHDSKGERAFESRMTDVVDRIKHLLDNTFATSAETGASPELLWALWARGKLFARLGEALHLTGDLMSARSAFDEAKRIGDALRGGSDEFVRPGAPSVSPVLGGRGTRAFIRLLLDQARIAADADGSRTPPAHGASWLPCLSEVGRDDANVALAACLQLDSLLRLRRRRTADTVGTMIDDARLACVRRDYATALQRLDEAGEAPFHPGSSTDVLLELATVRTRYAIECLRWLAQLPEQPSDAERKRMEVLANYLQPGRTLADLPSLMMVRAKRYQKTFWDMVKDYPPGFRYRIYARLTQAWIGALAADQSLRAGAGGAAEVRDRLTSALRCVDTAIREMRESGYQMHLAEAEGLSSSLSRKRATIGPHSTR